MIVLSSRSQEEIMREKLFTLSRTQREDMWRHFKQSDDRRVAERLHAILLLDSGQNAEAVSHILHVHPKTLKRWVKVFASGGEAALTSFNYVGGDGWLSDEQQQQFVLWLDADVRSTAEAIVWTSGSSNSLASPIPTAGCANYSNGLAIATNSPPCCLRRQTRMYKRRGSRPTPQKGGAEAPRQGVFC
jgi:hypothetical protein